MDRYELYTEYQTKENWISIFPSVFPITFSHYFMQNITFSFIQIIVTISYDCLPMYVHSQHQESKMKEIS